jgi:hypothetical protein
MKTKSVFLLCLLFGCLAYSQTTNAPLQKSEKNHVKLQLSGVSFLSYNESEQGEDGESHMGPPSKRVVFGDDTGKKNAIQAIVGDKSTSCPLLYQDVAYFIKGDKRSGRVGVSWYGGCPFEIKEALSVTTNLEMRVESTIEIESAAGNILFLSNESARPIVIQDGQVYTGCETFRNMVWLFRKSDIDFTAGDEKYHVTKAGATIKFSSKGMELTGIEKIK